MAARVFEVMKGKIMRSLMSKGLVLLFAASLFGGCATWRGHKSCCKNPEKCEMKDGHHQKGGMCDSAKQQPMDLKESDSSSSQETDK